MKIYKSDGTKASKDGDLVARIDANGEPLLKRLMNNSNTKQGIQENVKSRIYQLMDSFLVEAKDQYGRERSLDNLNQDRHLFVDNMLDLLARERKKAQEELIEKIKGELALIREAEISKNEKGKMDIEKYIKRLDALKEEIEK